MAARLTLKNSSVQFRNATGEQIGFGEICLNYHESGPYLQCKASNGEIVQIGGVYVSSIAPLNPIKGKQWLNTTNNTLYIYSGSAWVGVFVVNVDGLETRLEELTAKLAAMEDRLSELEA